MSRCTPSVLAVVSAIVLTVAGCATGSQSAFSPAVQTNSLARSSKAPDAAKVDLLYVATCEQANGQGSDNHCGVNVFSYPKGKFEGMIVTPSYPGGLCADKAGDVFVTLSGPGSSYAGIDEYAHGGKKPIATLTEPSSGHVGPTACAVDPTTGNLAVINLMYGAPVAIFAKAKGTPRYDTLPNPPPSECSTNGSAWPYQGAYDDRGNLFVVAQCIRSGSAFPAVYELASGGNSFRYIKFTGASARKIDEGVGGVSGVAWDGKYITLLYSGCHGGAAYCPDKTLPSVAYQIRVSGAKGAVVGSTPLGPFPWTGGTVVFPGVGLSTNDAQAKVVIGLGGFCASVGFWNYPSGGSYFNTLSVPPGTPGNCPNMQPEGQSPASQINGLAFSKAP